MDVYVASKFEEQERVRAVMKILTAAGHTITHDWTHETQFGTAAAVRDFEGVRMSDALVLVLEKDLPYRGAWTELGIALAYGIPVYVIGTYGTTVESNIFLTMPNVHLGWDVFHATFGTQSTLNL